MWYHTKRMKELGIRRDIQYLRKKASNGDASAMEEIGLDYFWLVKRKLTDDYKTVEDAESDDTDCMDGILSALYWFEKAVDVGKLDTNYWIGELFYLDLYCRGNSGSHYHQAFLEYLSRNGEKPILKEVMETKRGYLYKMLSEKRTIWPYDNEMFFIKAANIGDSSAAFCLGEIYLNKWYKSCKIYNEYPEEVPKPDVEDLIQAMKYLEYASKNGESEVFSLIFDIIQEMGKTAKQ